jgi:glucokinase
MILAGDIGGTKTLLAIADVENGALLHRYSYVSSNHENLATLIDDFLTRSNINAGQVDAACLAVAGPIAQTGATQSTKITNLPWQLNSGELAVEVGLTSLTLINDLVACAHGIPHVSANSIKTLKPGTLNRAQPRLIIGLGTGIGQALALPESLGGAVLASEAGHAHACAADALQSEIIAAMRARSSDDQVSVEQLLAGPAIARLHTMLNRSEAETKPSSYEIVAAANSGNDAALNTLSHHAGLLATHIRNMALTLIPGGGIYLTGGLVQGILPQLACNEFAEQLVNSAVMKELLARIPVYAITDTDVGLKGAIQYARSELTGRGH